jgi:hypothetical protein
MLNTSRTQWYKTLRRGFVFPSADAEESAAAVLAKTLRAVETHLRTSGSVRDYLETEPKGPGTNCPPSSTDALVKYVAGQFEPIDKSDPYVNLWFMRSFVTPALEFEREAVFRALRGSGLLTQDEETLVSDSIALASAIDKLWAAWYESLVVPHYVLTPTMQARAESLMKQRLPQFDYTVYEYSPHGGIVGRVGWAQAFPAQTEEICSILRRMAATPIAGLKAYFTALERAYGCTNISRLETLWETVDIIWTQIPRTTRLIPMHGIESGYEHPYGVSPEFRLEFRVGASGGSMDAYARATITHARTMGISEQLLEILEEKLRRTDIDVFLTMIRAGVSVNFRYSGQAAPNRQRILAEVGGRIFIDAMAPGQKMRSYLGLLERYCTESTRTALAPLITEQAQNDATVAHEFAHFVGRSPESDAALGTSHLKLCEEAKATHCGILAAQLMDPSPVHRASLVANMAARTLRFMQDGNRRDPTTAPYVRENLAAVTTLFESGVMSLSAEGVVIDADRAASSAWFDALRPFVRGVLDAYQTHDGPALERLAQRYCSEEHPQVASLIEWVNRK